MNRRAIVCLSLVFLLGACATSEQQKLLDADNHAATTQGRVLRYIVLPAADPAIKSELQAESGVLDKAEGSAAVTAADATLEKTLADNHINCGAAAADTCP